MPAPFRRQMAEGWVQETEFNTRVGRFFIKLQAMSYETLYSKLQEDHLFVNRVCTMILNNSLKKKMLKDKIILNIHCSDTYRAEYSTQCQGIFILS